MYHVWDGICTRTRCFQCWYLYYQTATQLRFRGYLLVLQKYTFHQYTILFAHASCSTRSRNYSSDVVRPALRSSYRPWLPLP
jgi:hypothetical protein